MSSKQFKKLILIIVSFILIVGLVVSFIFYLNTTNSSSNIEDIKGLGGYEVLKTDIISTLGSKDSQAATIADTLFETVGITTYESIERGGNRGNTFIYCDGYRLDAFIRAGTLINVYIGNVVVYKNPKEVNNIVSSATEFTYKQYDTMVSAFTKATKLDKEVGQSLFEKLTLFGINNLTGIKAGKLGDTSGFYGFEGMLTYFFTLDNNDFRKIYIVCDGFEPVEVYDSIVKKQTVKLSDVKITYGDRIGIANVLAWKVKQSADLEVIFPSALPTGDDSWLMVRNGSVVYIEVTGEIQEKEKKKSKDFVMKIDGKDRILVYLKIDNKVYID